MVLLGTEESTLITDTDLRTGTDTHLAMGQGADTMQPTDAVTKQYEVDNVTALHGDVTVCEDPAGGQVESSFDEGMCKPMHMYVCQPNQYVRVCLHVRDRHSVALVST